MTTDRVELVEEATGMVVSRLPVDARDMVARGGYVYKPAGYVEPRQGEPAPRTVAAKTETVTGDDAPADEPKPERPARVAPAAVKPSGK